MPLVVQELRYERGIERVVEDAWRDVSENRVIAGLENSDLRHHALPLIPDSLISISCCMASSGHIVTSAPAVRDPTRFTSTWSADVAGGPTRARTSASRLLFRATHEWTSE